MPQNKSQAIAHFLENHAKNLDYCVMCPRACGTRRADATGECGEPWTARIASANLHHGEEPPISGQRGSGTIFFAGCNLHCAFCQNYPISQLHQANRSCTSSDLAGIMLDLQRRGAHNINLVTPSHYTYQFVSALKIATEQGFDLPIVYNSSGYDSLPVIRDMEGIIDVYLPDAKYADNRLSEHYSSVPNYVEINRKALLEMYRQTGGEADFDNYGIVRRGLIIRHLVLPGETENSKNVLQWIAENLSPDVHLSLMAQYFPAHRAASDPQYQSIKRRLTHEEYQEVVDYAESLGFENGWFQEI